MTWDITQNEHNQKWYFSIEETDDGLFPTYDEFIECALKKDRRKADLISNEHFKTYIEKITYGTAPPLEIEIPESFDAKIITSSDKTSAELYVRKAKNADEELNQNIIATMLNNSGIKNINIVELTKTLDEFAEAENRETLIPLAKGTHPKRGKDRKLIVKVKKLSKEETKHIIKILVKAIKSGNEQPKVLYDKDFPLSEATALSMVKKNQVLFSFSEPELGEKGIDIYGNETEGLPGNDPFILDLRNIIQKKNEVAALCSGLLLAAKTKSGLKLRIIPYKNATIKAAISKDKMQASLILEAGIGAGRHLSLNMLKKALTALKLPETKYTHHTLDSAIQTARSNSSQIKYTICKGSLPVAPKSYQFDWHITFTNEDKAAVKKDATILETTFLENGKAGIDVFGNTVGIENASPVRLPEHDDSIRVHKNGNTTVFIAGVTGELSKEDGKLTIKTYKLIQSGIEETENISFGGNLTIQGSVGNYRSIKAEGLLTITGDAGVALIHSKDSLTMAGGIKGEHRGTLWAKNTIRASYAETARILAGGNIHIDEYTFRCIIKTNGTLSVTGSPGSLVGGMAHAARGLCVHNLGDPKKIRTIVSFGQDYLIKDKIDMYEKEIQQHITDIAHIDTELNKEDITTEEIEELHTQKALLLKQNNSYNLKVFALKENFETHTPSEVQITGTVYPGVIFESHGRYYEVREPMSSVCFSFNTQKGIIVYHPLKQPQNT